MFSAELARAAFAGVGSTGGEPLGIARMSSTRVPYVVMATTAAGPAQLSSYAKPMECYKTLLENNARTDRLGMVMSPRSYSQLVQSASTSDGHLLGVPMPLQRVQIVPTNSLGNIFSYGGSTSVNRAILGDFRDLAVGLRLEPTIEILRERFASNYQVGILAAARWDVTPLHDKSFVVLNGISS